MGGGYLRGPASMRCLWDECCVLCVFASEHQTGPAGEQETRMVDEGAWDLVRVPVRQRNCAGTEGIQEYACTWESRECCVCACASDLAVCAYGLRWSYI